MDGVERIYSAGTSYARHMYDPRGRSSPLIWLLVMTITFLLVDYLIGFRLFRWIYVGTVSVILLRLFYGRIDLPPSTS